MVRKPFDYFKEHYRGKIERDKKNLEFMHSQTDGFITWIIGFAFTGLLLMISNIKAVQLIFPILSKVVATCLFLTILTGIIYRYISFLMLSWEKSLEDYYIGAFTDGNVMPFIVDEDIETSSFEEMLDHLSWDFNEKIEFPEDITEDFKQWELPRLKEYYRKLCSYSRDNLKITLDHLATVDYTAHRIPQKIFIDDYINGLNTRKLGYNLPQWAKIRLTLFTVCLICFITVIVTIFCLLVF